MTEPSASDDSRPPPHNPKNPRTSNSPPSSDASAAPISACPHDLPDHKDSLPCSWESPPITITNPSCVAAANTPHRVSFEPAPSEKLSPRFPLPPSTEVSRSLCEACAEIVDNHVSLAPTTIGYLSEAEARRRALSGCPACAILVKGIKAAGAPDGYTFLLHRRWKDELSSIDQFRTTVGTNKDTFYYFYCSPSELNYP